jgi:sugar lactone lactonase YvrE
MKFTLLFSLCALSGSIMNAQSLTSIESAEFDPINHRFLVSNGNNIIEVNSNGIAIDEIGDGLPEATHGMEVMGSTLFAIDGDYVNAYDLTTDALLSSVLISEAGFLNGMASDGDGRVWVTDFSAKKIIEIDFSDVLNPTYQIVVANTVVTPNGICYDAENNRLVFVAWSGTSSDITAVSLDDYSMSPIVTNASLNSIDGIDNDNYGNYYLASWMPQRITKYNSTFSVSEVITVPGGLNNAADIAYAVEIDTLIIPNSGNNTVRLIGFSGPLNVEDSQESEVAMACYPNPVVDHAVISFMHEQDGLVEIDAMDAQGKIVYSVGSNHYPRAMQRVVLTDLPISQGNYFWRIRTSYNEFSIPFVKN